MSPLTVCAHSSHGRPPVRVALASLPGGFLGPRCFFREAMRVASWGEGPVPEALPGLQAAHALARGRLLGALQSPEQPGEPGVWGDEWGLSTGGVGAAAGCGSGVGAGGHTPKRGHGRSGQVARAGVWGTS